MAIVTYGSTITKLTGSIAGTTFQQNFSGSIVRAKPNKIINPSNLLSTKQLNLSVLVSQWNLLTSTQKTGWNNLATSYSHTNSWGNVKKISGFQWFMSNNLNLTSINAGRIGDAPAYLLPPPPPTYSLIFQSTALLLAFIEDYNPSPYTLLVYASPPVRTTSSKSRIAIFIIDSDRTPVGSYLDITSQYQTKFGYSLTDLLSFQNFNIVTRVCVIDPVTGFKSTYALNVSGNSPMWTSSQQFNTYPSSTNAHAYITWGDGSVSDFDFSGSFDIFHNYSVTSFHSVMIDITWSGGGAGWGVDRFGNIGHIIVHLESTPP